MYRGIQDEYLRGYLYFEPSATAMQSKKSSLSCHSTSIRMNTLRSRSRRRLSCGLSNDIGLVNCRLNNLLLFWIQILSQVLVERRLFLL